MRFKYQTVQNGRDTGESYTVIYFTEDEAAYRDRFQETMTSLTELYPNIGFQELENPFAFVVYQYLSVEEVEELTGSGEVSYVNDQKPGTVTNHRYL